MDILLRADSIGKSYGDRTVLTAATLRAVAGKVTYLVGRNGCGKSTLLNIAAGSLAADHGSVTFKGRAYLRPTWPALARRGLYYLPDRHLLSPDRTVRQHLDAIINQFGNGNSGAAAETCDIERFLDRRCANLSTGELRRVEVATAIARRPDCLLADEPFRHIDPGDRALLGAALAFLAAQGTAVVVTGHDVEDILGMADAVVWCTDGTTYELGTPAAAADHWRFVATYLGAARAARLTGERVRSTPATGGCDG